MIRFIIKLLNKYHTIVKFGVAGVTSTVTHFFVLTVLTELFGVWYLVSTAAGFVVSFGVSFYLQKFWTFRDGDKSGMHKQAAAYFTVVLIGLTTNTGSMYALVDIAGLHYLPAQLIVVAFIAMFNFIVYKYVIFRRVLPANRKKDESLAERKKRILITTPIYPPLYGGPANYVKLLAEELPAKGYEVRVITYADKKDCPSRIDYSADVIRIDRSLPKIRKYLRFFLAVNSLQAEADIIYAQDQINAGLPTALVCFLRDRKFILKVVGDHAWEQAQERFGLGDSLDEFQAKRYGARIEFWRRLRRRIAAEAAKIVVPSEYLKSIVKQWGVADKKITVIYNSVRTGIINESKDELRQKFGLTGPTLITSIRLLPWKGWQALLEIMPTLVGIDPGYKLIIVGYGPDQARFEAALADSPAKENIGYFARLEHDELMRRIKAADAFILNSNYEGLPHVIIEAQALGTPVLATSAGGNREIVEHEKTGLVFAYNDKEGMISAIKRIISDNVLRGRITAGARANLDKFGKEKMVERLIEELHVGN